MDHIAIMSKEIPFLERVLAGTKTIESRLYSSKRLPWNKISSGDQIYFKNVGEFISAQAQVQSVKQFENCSSNDIENLIRANASALGLLEDEITNFIQQVSQKRYVILLYLDKVKTIKPFQINKKGFGSMAAWITVPDIKQIVLN